MRQSSSYRTSRRNSVRDKSLAQRVSGESWKKPFPTTKEDKNGDEVPFVTYVGGKTRGKDYPYGSTRQGYPAPVVEG